VTVLPFGSVAFTVSGPADGSSTIVSNVAGTAFTVTTSGVYSVSFQIPVSTGVVPAQLAVYNNGVQVPATLVFGAQSLASGTAEVTEDVLVQAAVGDVLSIQNAGPVVMTIAGLGTGGDSVLTITKLK
jgi:hypothetical protein